VVVGGSKRKENSTVKGLALVGSENREKEKRDPGAGKTLAV